MVVHVARVHQPQVFRDVSDAVEAAHDTCPADVAIRIGLTGLSTTPRSVAATMFAPCSNITIAAREIAQLAERYKMSPHLNGDPIYCAIAAYRGSMGAARQQLRGRGQDIGCEQ